MKHSTIAIIGAGAVGSTTAYAIMLQNIIAELVLIDIDEKRCLGEILDLSDALSFCVASKIRRGAAEDARNADIIIIAAGIRQKPGQKRIELIEANKKIVTSIINNIKPINPHAIIIMVTNPVDILTLCAQESAGLPRNQVFGSGTFLDTQRLRGLIAKKLNIAEQSINAYILGEHGDSQFPAWSSAHADGRLLLSIPQFNKNKLDAIAQETRDRAYEIIAFKGATYFGIAACVASMCESIIFDQKRIMPLSYFIEDFGVCLSMPTVLGEKGIEQIIPIPLNEEEKELLQQSAHKLQDIKDLCK